ncbi:MAG: GMC family oxidoreductase [Thermomicrobiales bacterium]|nr:GMC family oxidoreductase [Thermomicrobiales bacterium]
MEPEETFDCDVAIVGSGMAGALIAWTLARAGAKVVILEAGPAVNRAQGLAHAFADNIVSTPDDPYPQHAWAPAPATLDPNNYLVQTGPDLFVSGYERIVGGTTCHWLGTCLRLVPSDFTMKSTYGVAIDWPLTYNDLEVWYGVAENAIGVAGDSDENNGSPRTTPYPMPAHPLS